MNSPVRAFAGVGGEPFVAHHGEGPYLWDVDGNRYTDYVLSWGPLVLGHAPPMVLDALQETMQRGTSFGVPTGLEVELAELIRRRMPHLEMLRFVSSGTEATMSAVRLARARHRPRPHPQVRGVLSRPRRLVPRAGRLGRGHARPAELARRAGRAGRADA